MRHRVDGWRARVLFAVAGAVLSSAMVTADRAGWFLIPAFGAAAVAAVLALVATARNLYVEWELAPWRRRTPGRNQEQRDDG